MPKGELIDLFKTPAKLGGTSYNSLDNKLKAKKRLDDETTDMMIIIYVFIFLFFLVFIMTVIHTDDVSKYGYKGPVQKYSLWDSIKMRLFGIPKHKMPSNCYIVPSSNNNNECITNEDTAQENVSSCVNSDGKSCQQVNDEWRKGLLTNNSKNDNTKNNAENEKDCPTEKYPHNIEIDAVNQCLKK